MIGRLLIEKIITGIFSNFLFPVWTDTRRVIAFGQWAGHPFQAWHDIANIMDVPNNIYIVDVLILVSV